MQLEELLSILGQGQAGGSDRFQVIPHESGNTVIADSRPASERPGFWGTPEGKGLMGDNQKLSIASAQQGMERYNQNYTQSLLQPFGQGPLPDYEHLKDDPKWWELYSANQSLADKIYGRVHGRSFTQEIVDAKELEDTVKKSLMGKIGEGKLYQNAKGEMVQMVQRPDEMGELKWKEEPMSGEMAAWMQRAGGLKRLGQVDIKGALAAKALAGQTTAGPGTSLQGAPPATIEPQPGASEQVPAMFGLGQALGGMEKGIALSTLERQTVEPSITLGNVGEYWKNVGQRIVGGKVSPMSGPRESGASFRQMVDVLRARKGLPPLSDRAWEMLQSQQGGYQGQRPAATILNQ